MRDPLATGMALVNFAGAAEDAVKSANADKAHIRTILGTPTGTTTK